MSSPTLVSSAAMRRAALAELKRLARARAKVAARADVLSRQFTEAREELDGLDDRASILEALAGAEQRDAGRGSCASIG